MTELISDYDLGYEDGYNGYFMAAVNPDSDFSDYLQGYEDGCGDREAGQSVRPVDEDYYKLNKPPFGYEWTGEKRVPVPGDHYLTKNGNAKVADKVRGNNQTRHILRPIGDDKLIRFLIPYPRDGF